MQGNFNFPNINFSNGYFPNCYFLDRIVSWSQRTCRLVGIQVHMPVYIGIKKR